MATKTVKFNKSGIEKLPADKPAVYKILSDGGKVNYVGVAKRGRVPGRVAEHLPGAPDAVPGTRVRVEQATSIEAAEKKEASIIARSNPKYNIKGK